MHSLHGLDWKMQKDARLFSSADSPGRGRACYVPGGRGTEDADLYRDIYGIEATVRAHHSDDVFSACGTSCLR